LKVPCVPESFADAGLCVQKAKTHQQLSETHEPLGSESAGSRAESPELDSEQLVTAATTVCSAYDVLYDGAAESQGCQTAADAE